MFKVNLYKTNYYTNLKQVSFAPTDDRKIGIIFPGRILSSFGSAVQTSLHSEKKNY